MTTSTQDHVRALFDDARQMQVQALERLNEGDIRDARRRHGALPSGRLTRWLLSRNGEEPPSTHDTTEALSVTGHTLRRVRNVGRFATSPGSATYTTPVYYTGLLPDPDTERRIRETAQYIDDAQDLAAG